MIDREDMLELTRRMTPARTHFVRVAGAYMDEEGFLDGNFNTNFLKLKGQEKTHTLEMARTVLISETNRELCRHRIPGMKPGSIWQLLYALRDCELKNDALLMTLYEFIAEKYPVGKPYAIYVYFGAYDVPMKAEDKYRFDVSEEVYRYLIVSIGPVDPDYNPGMPECGFLYPAFAGRSTDPEHVNVFAADAAHRQAMKEILDL